MNCLRKSLVGLLAAAGCWTASAQWGFGPGWWPSEYISSLQTVLDAEGMRAVIGLAPTDDLTISNVFVGNEITLGGVARGNWPLGSTGVTYEFEPTQFSTSPEAGVALLSGVVVTNLSGVGTLTLSDASAWRSGLGLGSVENTALSTWVGSANLTTAGALAPTSVTLGGVTHADWPFTVGPGTATVANRFVLFNDTGGKNVAQASFAAPSTAGSTGMAMISDGAGGVEWGLVDTGAVNVEGLTTTDLASISSVTGTAGDVVYVTDAGREGPFYYSATLPSWWSALMDGVIHTNTAGGYWIRAMGPQVKAEVFGVSSANSAADNTTALHNAFRITTALDVDVILQGPDTYEFNELALANNACRPRLVGVRNPTMDFIATVGTPYFLQWPSSPSVTPSVLLKGLTITESGIDVYTVGGGRLGTLLGNGEGGLIEDVVFYNIREGLYINNGAGSGTWNGLTWRRCTFDTIANNGVFPGYTTNMLFDACVWQDYGLTPFVEMGPPHGIYAGPGAMGLVVRNSVFGPSIWTAVQAAAHASSGGSSIKLMGYNSIIEGNLFNVGNIAVIPIGGSGYQIIGNRFKQSVPTHGTTREAVFAFDAEYVSVVGNMFEGTLGVLTNEMRRAISLLGAPNSLVADNHIRDVQDGIYAAATVANTLPSNITIQNNYIHYSTSTTATATAPYAIRLTNVRNTRLLGNTVESRGAVVFGTARFAVFGGINTVDGVGMSAHSQGNVFISTNVMSNALRFNAGANVNSFNDYVSLPGAASAFRFFWNSAATVNVRNMHVNWLPSGEPTFKPTTGSTAIQSDGTTWVNAGDSTTPVWRRNITEALVDPTIYGSLTVNTNLTVGGNTRHTVTALAEGAAMVADFDTRIASTTLTASATFDSAANQVAGTYLEWTGVLVNSAATNVTVTLPADWALLNGTSPVTVPSGKRMILDLASIDTVATNVVASYVVQP